MGGKRIDYEGNEGKALVFLSELGHANYEIEIITGRSDDSIRKARNVYKDLADAIRVEIGQKKITRGGFLEATVCYLYSIGKKTSEISKYVKRSDSSVSDIKSRCNIRDNINNAEHIFTVVDTDTAEENSSSTTILSYEATQQNNLLLAKQEKESPETRQKLFVSFTKSNYDFLSVMATSYGISKTALVNQIIAEYREAHSQDAAYQEALDIAEKVAARRAAAGYKGDE